ncbi:MAG: vWA domain-containing protein [Longimicrobiales bacterium]
MRRTFHGTKIRLGCATVLLALAGCATTEKKPTELDRNDVAQDEGARNDSMRSETARNQTVPPRTTRNQAGQTRSADAESRTSNAIARKYANAAIAPAALGRHADPGFNTESYGYFVENTFLSPDSDPLSTFSIDVDRASYANVRRFIEQGSRPPMDAVRIEELINYFPYAYDEPRNGQPFAVTTELARAPWEPRHYLLRIGLQAERIATESLPPSNLVLLIDVSGSMQSSDKLPLLKQALGLLVDALREDDRVAMVVYAGAAGLVLPSTSGDRKDVIMHAIHALEAGGSTAGGEGLRLAYRIARENFRAGGNNRVILATDGDFNVGESSDAAMIRLIEEERGDGIFLTVLGFGTGNLKDSKMEAIADRGNGNYAYIDGLPEARKVLVHEMGGTLLAVAKDVKLQVEFNPAHVQAYRLIGYENRLLAVQDFNDDRKDAGELGAGHTITALYEIVPAGLESNAMIRGVDSLRYSRPAARANAENAVSRNAGPQGANELGFVKLRYKTPSGEISQLMSQAIANRVAEPTIDLTFASAVASFGMILRESEHRGSATLDQVLALAHAGMGEDEGGYRGGFVRIVERYRDLAIGIASTHGDPRR